MKYLLSILFVFTTTLYAIDTEQIFDLYGKHNRRQIIDFKEDPKRRFVTISLSDGTVWNCFYESLGHRQQALMKLETGLSVFIFPHPEQICNITISGKGYGGVVYLFGLIEPLTRGALPTITGILDGKISLSDGSIWQETAYIYYSSTLWKIGDHIVVQTVSDSAYLINLDHSGNQLCPFSADTNILDWVTP